MKQETNPLSRELLRKSPGGRRRSYRFAGDEYGCEQEGQKYSTATAALAGSCIALHVASHVWISRELGPVGFSARACNEILDGAKRLPSSRLQL